MKTCLILMAFLSLRLAAIYPQIRPHNPVRLCIPTSFIPTLIDVFKLSTRPPVDALARSSGRSSSFIYGLQKFFR